MSPVVHAVVVVDSPLSLARVGDRTVADRLVDDSLANPLVEQSSIWFEPSLGLTETPISLDEYCSSLPADLVVVISTVEPFLNQNELTQLIECAIQTNSSAGILRPISETLKVVDEAGRITETVDRGSYFQLGGLEAHHLKNLSDSTVEHWKLSTAPRQIEFIDGQAGVVRLDVEEDLAVVRAVSASQFSE